MSLNLYTLEYIAEVAKCGSISKAAQNLFLSQPHLSNTIKSVEQYLGVTLFLRSAKGMTLTEEGRVFVSRAQSILSDVNSLEAETRVKPGQSVRGSVSVTRSHQINRCITNFINEYGDRDSFVLHVKETNPFQVVEDVYTKEAELGVLHFFDAQKEYFFNSFRSHSINFQKHYEREFLLAMSKENSLAGESKITKSMLEDQIIVIYGDYEIPSASYEAITKVDDIIFSRRRVYAYERATAMEVLNRCPNTYMWITGLHRDTLDQYGLILRRCSDVKVINLGYSIFSSSEPLSWSAQKLLEKMLEIDWAEEVE